MTVCQVCESIAFDDLPGFPWDSYATGLSGKQYQHSFYRMLPEPPDAAVSTVRYHANLESLRAAAAAECALCVIILAQVEALLAELVELHKLAEAREARLYPTPTFDMWLVRRPDGDQGFWVMSEVPKSKDMSTISLIAAFAFAVPDDDLLNDVIRGRLAEEEPGEKSLKRIAEWDRIYSNDRPHLAFTPGRLIDVQSSASKDTVTLVEVESNSGDRYTALRYAHESEIRSYWEDNPKPDNDCVRVETLPKTFRDAITVTQALGIRYIWIDSLCIRDGPQAWERDSESATAAYENAYLTISATGSSDVNDGLFFKRPLQTSTLIVYKKGANITVFVYAILRPLVKEVVRDRYIEMRDEPISQGLWSFQERVFSPRTVHFASDQMYFETLSCFVAEDGLLKCSAYHTIAETLPEDNFRQKHGGGSPIERWRALIAEYNRLPVANPLDKLPALANIARVYQRMMGGDEYLVGHWKSSFFGSLAWQAIRSTRTGDDTIPSWSILSIDGSCGAHIPEGEAIAVITDMKMSLADESKPFGRIDAVSLSMTAPVLPLKVMSKDEHDRPGKRIYLTLAADESKEVAFLPDTMSRQLSLSADKLLEMEMHALVINKVAQVIEPGRGCNPPDRFYCLVVTPADASGNNTMKRIGQTQITARDLTAEELQAAQSDVVLL
ncbi:hypothetical protein VHEMI02987 [[Torrubiella] hemipterigena]|uniref:Heterokaryon incompatibility domain-containing protein n=1 Tax=[Torrubiella] hemipterigena TaxID=1531966 RepID=A0A0A1TC36_9HYPO|nr:hypothetical protein VHEMI02987 [[Torrubiella] hemipterigena]